MFVLVLFAFFSYCEFFHFGGGLFVLDLYFRISESFSQLCGVGTDALGIGFEFPFNVEGERVAGLLKVEKGVVTGRIETSAVETCQADIDACR